ncbi:MAG: branched-chain amino acid ABC transporter ATP-binding protein/permease [Pseudomonadota bacterium]
MILSLRSRLSRMVKDPRVAIATIALLTLVSIILATQIGGYFVFILALMAINLCVGVGLNILLGLSGQISFGHVGFFLIGAYAVGIATLAGWSFWIALPMATLLGAVTGGLLALPALRVSGPYLAMMTIAFAFIVEHGAIEWRDLTGGQNGLMGFPVPEAFGRVFFEMEMAILAILFAGLSLVLYHVLARGHWGLAMRAVSDSEVAAQSVGIDPLRVKTLAFVLSAALAALAGGLFTPLQGFISPGSFPFFQSILFLLAVVVGGSRTLLGPVLGVLVTVLLPELLSGLAEYRLLFFGGLMLGVLLAAPRGIMGLLQRVLIVEDPKTAVASGMPLSELVGRQGAEVDLAVSNLSISFGGVRAAQDVSFTAEPGRITSIIGPNGAGKTTVLNMVGGFYVPDSGTIRLDHDLAGKTAWAAARAGIARTYQTTQLFEQLSVIDNLLTADRAGALGMPFGPPPSDAARSRAEGLLAFVGYDGPLDREAAALPHVDRRLVEIARALATRPRVLLLDEPAAGLSQSDKEQLALLLRQIAEVGIAVVLVEHDMGLVMGVSDDILVLDAGTPIAHGTPVAVRNDPAVLRAYLGDNDYPGRPRTAPWTGERVAVLGAHKLVAGYGAAPVLQQIDISVDPAETVAILGANGAGKSTLMRALAGLHRPVEGSVLLDDAEISGTEAHEIAAHGLALVPEGRQVFPELSVRDNILLGAFTRKDLDADREIEALLTRFPRLRDRIDMPAGVLSGGEQQMLAVARGLIAKPRILLLDEPSLGLAPAMVRELFDTLADLRDEGVTILLVDQMATLALAISDRAYVLENGEVVKTGTASDLSRDTDVEQAYLGAAE